MRFIASLLLTALAASTWSAQAYDVTTVHTNLTPFTLTSTESAVTFTNNGTQRRYVVIVVDQAWGWDSATSAFSNKYPLAASQSFTFEIDPGTTIIYFQASSTSGNFHGAVLASGN